MNGKLLIKPSKRSIRKFIRRVRQIIRDNRHIPAGQLIVKLNPVLRGWAMYHRHVVSKAILYSLHHEIIVSLTAMGFVATSEQRSPMAQTEVLQTGRL